MTERSRNLQRQNRASLSLAHADIGSGEAWGGHGGGTDSPAQWGATCEESSRGSDGLKG